MRWDIFFSALGQLLVLFPAGTSSFHTAHAFLAQSKRRTVTIAALLFSGTALLGALVRMQWEIPMWILGCIAACVLLAVLRFMTILDWPRLLAVYTGILAIETFPLQFAYIFDAHLHPAGGAGSLSIPAAFFQLLLATILMLAFAYPASHAFATLLYELDLPKYWYSTVGISAIFLVLNLLVTPLSYTTLRAGRIETIFLAFEATSMAILIAVYLLFYRGSGFILAQMQLRERALIYEREARHYQDLRTYLAETTRLRHDFRHSVRLMASLAQQGDWDALTSYLTSYEQNSFPESAETWCYNAALNALFVYYARVARENDIVIEWKIDLPDPLPFSEVDMSSLFGNLLENALAGCLSVEPEKRICKLTCHTQQDGVYVVTTNTFNGVVQKDTKGYLSTKREGNGSGLRSIAVIAERYGGHARFTNSSSEFWADVYLPTSNM